MAANQCKRFTSGQSVHAGGHVSLVTIEGNAANSVAVCITILSKQFSVHCMCLTSFKTSLKGVHIQ